MVIASKKDKRSRYGATYESVMEDRSEYRQYES